MNNRDQETKEITLYTNIKRKPRMSVNPPQVMLAGFAAIILTGAALLSLPAAVAPGQEVDYLTSLFTATSAVCVTGLVVVDTATHWTTFGHAVILILIQVGGLGFMTMGTLLAILLGWRVGLRQRLLIQESLHQVNLEGIVRLVKYVLLFTFVIEAGFAVYLAFLWSSALGWLEAVWYGLFHSVSAFNNAGFDLMGNFNSLTGYTENIAVNFGFIIPVLLGGIGFGVITELLERVKKPARLSLHAKLTLSVTGILIVTGTVIIYLLESSNSLQPLSPQGKVLAAFFQAVTPRTAGFNTLDTGGLCAATQFFIMVLMFIGASPGSTGGGIKTTTAGSLAAFVISVFRGREDVEIFRRRVGRDQIMRAMVILLTAMSLIVVVALLLTVTENTGFHTIVFETVSAFGTVGLSMGLTPDLTAAGRVLIIMTMFLGRLGPLTLVFAMMQGKCKTSMRLPEEKIILG